MRQQVLAPKQNTSQWIPKVIQICDTIQPWLIYKPDLVGILKCEVTLIHFIALHAEYFNSFGHDPSGYYIILQCKYYSRYQAKTI